MEHTCPSLQLYKTVRPLILIRWEEGAWALVAHDRSPEELAEYQAGTPINCCPWTGEQFEALGGPPRIHNVLHDERREPSKDGTGYCCRAMDEMLTHEDLDLLFDDVNGEYVIPIYDGPPERNWLGNTGIRIRYCPWCGKRLPASKRALQSQDPLLPEKVVYSVIAQSPRYF